MHSTAGYAVMSNAQPAITLRPMLADEFPSYRDYFVVDYADEIAENYGYTLEKSRIIAREELADDLPQTVNTPNHVLLCIENENGEMVGYLWYKLMDDGETAFGLDFIIFEPFRKKGYGKAAMGALEKQLSHTGVEQLKLRVAFYNKRALRLYENVGFSVTGYNMIKHIKEKT